MADADLSAGERTVLILNPHWKTVLWPFVLLVVVVIVAAVLLIVIPHNRLQGAERIAVGAVAIVIAAIWLVIESAGEHGQLVLNEIPDVEKVQATLFQLVEDEQARLAREDR